MDETPDPRKVPKSVYFERTSNIDEWLHALADVGVDAVKYVPYRNIKKVETGKHRLGHTVKLVPVETRLFPIHLLRTMVRTHSGETSRFYRLESLIFTLNLLREVRQDRVDALHYMNYFSSNFVFSFIPARVVPVVAMYTGGDLPTRSVAKWGWFFSLHLAMSRVKLILIGDYPERVSRLVWLTGGDRSKIRIFDILRVNTKIFHPTDRRAARERLGLPPDAFEILCVLSVIPLPHKDPNMKDPYALLRVFRAALDDSKDADLALVVVGSGPGLEQMKEAARSLGLERRASFVGHVSHYSLPDYYGASNLVFIPFKLESLKHTHVLIEAFACARASVAFANRSPFREDWEGGFMISAEEDQGGAALARIAGAPDLILEKERQALSLAPANDLQGGMETLSGYYRQVLASRGKRGSSRPP